MKKTLLITGVLLALTSSIASAAGINLSWNDCGALGVANKTLACNSNTGNNDMFLSFDPPSGLTMVTGNNQIIDLQSMSDPLPAWWQFKNAGTCRLAALQALSAITGSCFDTWQGQGHAGIAAYLTSDNSPSVATNRARIIGSIAVSTAFATPVDAGTEYFSMLVRITNAKTVGTGACAGCLDPITLVLNEILITQEVGTPGGSSRLTNPANENCVMVNGGIPNGCLATPTRNRTWGQVKSLYR